MAIVDKFSGQVTAEEVFFRAMANIAGLSLAIYSSADTEWQKNALNYEKSVDALEALAGPFLTSKYFNERSRIIEEARIDYFVSKKRMSPMQLMKEGHNLEVKMICNVSNERLRLIQICLHEKGILFGKTYQVVEEDDEGTVPVRGDEIILEREEEANVELPIPDEINADNIEELEDRLYDLCGLGDLESDEDNLEDGLDELDE